MIKLIVFDWNATILADTAACFAADKHIIRMFGGERIDLKTYSNTVCHPFVDYYVSRGCNRKLILRNRTKLAKEFHRFYRQRSKHARTRRGARAVLSWVKNQGIPAIILSNHTQHGVRLQLKRLRLEPFFGDILAHSEVDAMMHYHGTTSKHARLMEYLTRNRVKHSEILLIGDSPEEMEIGKKIGAVTVGLTGGYYAEWRLREKGPDFLIHNIKNLIPIIKKINAPK